jgi:hypothetical protein
VVSVDFAKEDYVLKGLILSEVREYVREGKPSLIFVRFVGSKAYGASPQMLYFGELELPALAELRGQKVDVLLQASDRGFNVAEIKKSA